MKNLIISVLAIISLGLLVSLITIKVSEPIKVVYEYDVYKKYNIYFDDINNENDTIFSCDTIAIDTVTLHN
jgi:hypothetical protein